MSILRVIVFFLLRCIQVFGSQLSGNEAYDRAMPWLPRNLPSCPDPDFKWTEAADLTLIGRAFNDVTATYTRLPDSAKGNVRQGIWGLSQQSAGLAFAFETNSPIAQLEYNLTLKSLGMWHMPSTGVSGMELWGLDPTTDTWRWVHTAHVSGMNVCENLYHLTDPGTPGAIYPTKWLIYFPLYNGVSGVRIGVPDQYDLTPCRGDCSLGLDKKPIVWYGSSITQGACASKPGDAYTNAISRALRRPILNFGFSGNCYYETDVMHYLLSIDTEYYIVDCNPNSEANGYEFVYDHSISLVKQMVAAKPGITIFLASGSGAGPRWLYGNTTSAGGIYYNGTLALRRAYDYLQNEIPATATLKFVDGEGILSQPEEWPIWQMTVAGTHPSSLGMERFTKFWTPILSDFFQNEKSEVLSRRFDTPF